MILSEKLDALRYFFDRDPPAYEDCAGHLCDLLELCRLNITPSIRRPFSDLIEMIECYGESPTPPELETT